MKTLSATDTLVAAPEDGMSVTVKSIMYATSTDGTTPPSSGWTTGIPTVPEGGYLWTKITFSSGDPAYMVSKQMKNGTSVTVSSIKYAVGSSATSHPTSGWSTTFPSSIGQGKYLWVWTVYSDGTSAYSVSFQGNDGENVTVVSTDYAVSTSGTTIPSSGWSATIPSVPKGSYLWTRVKFSNGEYSYTCAYHGKDGSPGSTGASGPLPYPCGSYDSTVSYTRDAFKCPVVVLENIYYGMKKAGTVKGVNPKTDVANNGGNWEVFDMFKWLMSEVAFINFGKLASAVFYGQYMFSQYGINAAGNPIETADGYKDFNASDPMNKSNSFRPNILLDLLRGKAWLKDAEIAGSVTLRSLRRRIVRSASESYVSLSDSSGFYLDGNYSMPVLSDDCSMDLHAMVLEPSSRSIHGYGNIFFPSSNNVVFYNGEEHVGVRHLVYAHSGGFIKVQFFGVCGENGCNNWYVGVEQSGTGFNFTVELYP